MNYLIIIALVTINFIKIGFVKRKNKDEVYTAIDLDKEKEYHTLIKRINIGLILINIFTVGLSIVFNTKDMLAHIFALIILIASFIFVFIVNKNNYKSEFNVIRKREKHLYNMIINSILCIALLDRVGALKETGISSYISLLGFVLFIMNVIEITKFLKENKNMVKYKAKKEDYLEDIKTTLFIEKYNILKYMTVGIIIIILIYVNVPFSYVAYVLILILALVIYNSDLGKINKEKKKLYNNIINIHQNPGSLYIYQYKNHIEYTKNMMLFIILFVIGVLCFFLIGELEFFIIGLTLYMIVIYALLNKKKKTIEAAYNLNEELINKDKYKINLKKEFSDVIESHEILINNVFYKVVYVDDNKNIYISDNVLYNIKGIHDDINIYINTEDMEDYRVVEEGYY